MSPLLPWLQAILEQLDTLHLPLEWRNLFATAGVPQGALDDVASTRTLIALVSTHVEYEQEPNTERPPGVPKLTLVDSDEERKAAKLHVGLLHDSDSSDSDTGTVSDSHNGEADDEVEWETEDEPEPACKKGGVLITPKIGGSARHKNGQPEQKKTTLSLKTPSSLQATSTQSVVHSGSIQGSCESQQPCVEDPETKTHNGHFSDNTANGMGHRDLTDHKTAFLEALKAKVNEMSLGENLANKTTKGLRKQDMSESGAKLKSGSGSHQRSATGFSITASELQNQRAQLQSASLGPSQLTNLNAVDDDKLDGLAQILRKVKKTWSCVFYMQK